MDVRRPASWLLSAVLLAVPAVLAGCFGAGNSSWPPVEGQTALSDLNQPAVRNVQATALIWATRKYPPAQGQVPGTPYTEPVAINLPPGTSRTSYLMVQDDVSSADSPVLAVRDATEPLPTYHISRVVVRGTDAIVDVVVPRNNLGPGAVGEQRYEKVTLEMRGGLRPWQVVRHRTYAIATADVPELNPIPAN